MACLIPKDIGLHQPYCTSLSLSRHCLPDAALLTDTLDFVAFSAGAETTSGVLSWWLQAMLLNPEAQRRAHQEMDRVVGRERVPTFDDLPRLNFLRATVRH